MGVAFSSTLAADSVYLAGRVAVIASPVFAFSFTFFSAIAAGLVGGERAVEAFCRLLVMPFIFVAGVAEDELVDVEDPP